MPVANMSSVLVMMRLCISRHDIVIINSMLGINKPAVLCQAGRQGADHICRDSGRTSRVLGIRDESISKTLVTTSPHVLLVQQQTSSSPRREVSPSTLPQSSTDSPLLPGREARSIQSANQPMCS